MLAELNCSNYEDRAILYAAGELTREDPPRLRRMPKSARPVRPFFRREIGLRKTLALRPQPADTLDRSDLLLARCRSELFEVWTMRPHNRSGHGLR